MPLIQSALFGKPAAYPSTPPATSGPSRRRRELQPGETAPSKAKASCAYCWDEQARAQQRGTAVPRRRAAAYRVGTPAGERLACSQHAHQVAEGGAR